MAKHILFKLCLNTYAIETKHFSICKNKRQLDNDGDSLKK